LCGQTDGATPLFITSQEGHVEAVRALVELGAAVNQAEVGFVGRDVRG
jgi:ankyrin repeat protein